MSAAKACRRISHVARQWTERAAAAGNRRAMHDLGVYFARGEGAPLDEAAAFRWFRQAAELGVADSQYNLGVLYQQGRGVNASAVGSAVLVLGRGPSGRSRRRRTRHGARSAAGADAGGASPRARPGLPSARGQRCRPMASSGPRLEQPSGHLTAPQFHFSGKRTLPRRATLPIRAAGMALCAEFRAEF
jgi:TPR repeat protein